MHNYMDDITQIIILNKIQTRYAEYGYMPLMSKMSEKQLTLLVLAWAHVWVLFVQLYLYLCEL